MLDFDEELRKFHPSMEVEDIDASAISQDFTDIADALVSILDKANKTGE